MLALETGVNHLKFSIMINGEAGNSLTPHTKAGSPDSDSKLEEI